MKFIYNGQELDLGAPSGIPTKVISYDEYQALSEDEKNEEILYLVEDAPAHEVFPQGMTIYSGEETVIGSYFGKPLYRIVYRLTIESSEHTSHVDLITLSIDKVASLKGCVDTGDLRFQEIPYFTAENNACNAYIYNGWLRIHNRASDFVGKTAYIILEYTKTTDVEGSIEVLPVNYVQDYDTEDGWHVRKYSDGYVEMSIRTTVVAPAWTTYTDASSSVKYTTNPTIPAQALPVPLVERYTELVNCGIDRGGSLGGSNGTIMCQAEPSATPLTTISTVYPTCLGDVNANWTLVTTLHVTGRWK